MNIRVYTKRACPHCLSAKVWLKQRGYEFEEIPLEKAENAIAFKAAYPQAKTAPQIIIDGENIGGFSDLIRTDL